MSSQPTSPHVAASSPYSDEERDALSTVKKIRASQRSYREESAEKIVRDRVSSLLGNEGKKIVRSTDTSVAANTSTCDGGCFVECSSCFGKERQLLRLRDQMRIEGYDVDVYQSLKAKGLKKYKDCLKNLKHSFLAIRAAPISSRVSPPSSAGSRFRVTAFRANSGNSNDSMGPIASQASAAFGTRSENMLIVDPAFRHQFDIARPSSRYKIIHKSLPNTFVGRLSDLENLVDIVVAEIRKSFEVEEMSIPPWRRKDAFMSKWKPMVLFSGDRTDEGFVGA